MENKRLVGFSILDSGFFVGFWILDGGFGLRTLDLDCGLGCVDLDGVVRGGVRRHIFGDS